MIYNQSKLSGFIYMLICWLFISSASPFVIWSWPFHPHKILITSLLAIIVYVLLKHKNTTLSKDFFFVFFTLIFYQTFCFAYFGHTDSITVIIQLVSICLFLIFLEKYVGYKRFVRTYVYVILLMAIGGTIIFFLHLFVGVTPLFSSDYGGAHLSQFLYLTTTNSFTDAGDLRILRYAGFFDESGAFSLNAIYALLLNRLYVNNKQVEYCIVFFSMFSMSAAFFITVPIYYILFSLNKKNLLSFILILLVGSVCINLIEKHKDANPIMQRVALYTIERFDKDTNKLNSRSDLQEEDKLSFFNNPILGSGKSRGANVYETLAYGGIVGSLIMFLPLILVFYYILKSPSTVRVDGLKVLFIIILQVFHRPNITSVLSLVIIFSFCYYYKHFAIQRP